MNKETKYGKNGSALLIVLGLLGFLMISAVAFSISMRTEHAAAANYKQSLVARDLLQSAFADARFHVNRAMADQLPPGVGYPVPIEHRTRNSLTPFAFRTSTEPGLAENAKPDFGRFISSCVFGDGSATFSTGILNQDMINHIPAYIAPPIIQILEASSGVDTLANGNVYARIDSKPSFKPLMSGNNIIGRAAWVAINVSDSLDINSLLAAGNVRGLGILGSDFAFGSQSQNPAYPFEIFGQNVSSETSLVTPFGDGFSSVADLLRAGINDPTINAVLPIDRLHWMKAMLDQDTYNGDLYSPFTTYSYWPATNRTDTTSQLNFNNQLSCGDITENYVKEPSNVQDLFRKIKQVPGLEELNESEIYSLQAALRDYIDKDLQPSGMNFADEQGGIEYGLTMPSVEAVPMISDVGYNLESFYDQLQDVAKLIKPENDNLSEIGKNPENLTAPKFLISLEDFELADTEIIARTAFPFKTDAPSSNVEIDSFCGISTKVAGSDEAAQIGKSTLKTKNSSVNFSNKSYYSTVSVNLDKQTGAKTEFTPTLNGDQEITQNINLIVDFYFRAKITTENKYVDAAPCQNQDLDGIAVNASRPEQKYKNRTHQRTPTDLDSSFFRISFARSIEFKAKWVEDSEGGGKDGQKKYNLQWSAVVNKNPNFEDLKNSPTAESFKINFPVYGTWSSIDPRYNWISPSRGMKQTLLAQLGVNGGGNTYYSNVSSPHWIFYEDLNLDTQRDSSVVKNYISSNPLPFGLNSVEKKIYYATGNIGKMLLPGEIGFLPYPMKATTLEKSVTTYNRFEYNAEQLEEIKKSFFRTLPVFEIDGNTERSKFINAFTAESLPISGTGQNMEEHRGIMNAFCGADSKALADDLRALVLLGMPGSIQQAAKVSKDRQTGETLRPIIPGLETTQITATAPVDAPFDNFIKILFPYEDTKTEWADADIPTRADFLGSGSLLRNKATDFNNNNGNNAQLNQTDLTTFYAMARESFGDRQQLFLYLLHADKVDVAAGQTVHTAAAQSTARAVALVWRDAYGYLPERVVYFQVLP